MKEATYIRQNKQRWQAYQNTRLRSLNAEELVSRYRELLADLSYVKTQYPDSRLVDYLNVLTRKYHDRINTPPTHNIFREISRLLFDEVPMLIADARKDIFITMAIFLAFVIGGIIMAAQDLDNVCQTLGYNYVNMTIANIKNGVPTNVYNDPNADGMFIMIWVNNAWVDLKMLFAGLLPFIGTGTFLYANGVMLGEFQTIFFLYDVGIESMMVIWMHGTLEITSLIIAAAGSLELGRSWVTAGSYSIGQNFRRKGLRAIKLFFSTVPLTFLAAVIESYCSRHAEWHWSLKLLIIGLSLAFVISYYIYLPYVTYQRYKACAKREDEEYD